MATELWSMGPRPLNFFDYYANLSRLDTIDHFDGEVDPFGFVLCKILADHLPYLRSTDPAT